MFVFLDHFNCYIIVNIKVLNFLKHSLMINIVSKGDELLETRLSLFTLLI